MMFDRLLRSLGLKRGQPAAAAPPDAPDRLAAISARLPADRVQPGTLEAYDAAGVLVSGPWPVVARADPALAAARGNLSRDRLRPFGDTPEGAFHLAGRRPGAAGFGPNDVLLLHAVSGPAAAAGRTMLLLHGGDPSMGATDGSLRVPDAAMAEMLALTSDPASRSPRVVLSAQDQAGYDDWLNARPDAGSPGRQAWFRAQGYAAGERYDVDDGWYGDGGFGWADLYDAYAATDAGPSDAGWQADQAAAAALADAGFDAAPPDAPAFDPAFDGPGADFSGGGAYDR